MADYIYKELAMYKPFYKFDARVYIDPRKGDMGKYSKVYNNFCRRVCEEIVKEFQSYLRAGQADGRPGGQTYHKHPAVARGESDTDSLMNSLEVKKSGGRWSVVVVNQVWLYQEYGFKMKRMPPRYVAERILEWAVRKGFIQIQDTMHRMEPKFTMEQKRNKKGRFKKGFESVAHRRYKLFRFEPKKRRHEPGYRTLTAEDVSLMYYGVTQEQEGFQQRTQTLSISTRYHKELERLMWKLAKAVVDNSQTEDNRRLFLTCAYRNVIEDYHLLKQIESEELRREGLR